MTEAERIAAKLTEAQRKAVLKLSTGRWSSWSAGLSLGTLNALERREIAEASNRDAVGAVWSPQTIIKWKLTPLGLAVRAILQGDAV